MSQARRSRRRQRRLKRFSVLRVLALLALYLTSAGAGLVTFVVAEFARDLPPDLTALKDPPSKVSRVYSAEGELIGEFYLEKRVVVPLERIPEHVRQAFISAEDRRFWQHPGFDVVGIARAAYANFRAGSTRQGASTITQQLTRMLMLSPERSYERKIKEVILSVRVERELSKRDILEMYLNRVNLGGKECPEARDPDEHCPGCAYGVQAAAEMYFGKDVAHLSVAEAALLAGLVQRPNAYSPLRNPEAARGRQRYVIARMYQDDYISHAQSEAALREPLALVDSEVSLNHVAAPYFVEHVRRWAERRYGSRVFDGGLSIFSTLDMRMQRSAEAAVRDGLADLDRRIGFRGPLGQLDEDELAAFRAGPPRPYLPGLDTLDLGSGAILLPEVAYIGAVVELQRAGGVLVAVGDRALPVERMDARRLRAWRGEPDGSRRRETLALGHLVPVRLHEGPRDEPVFVLAQEPDVQAALVAMDPATGRVEALVGGLDFRRNQFNRAVQARRQIGSAIKPFLYAAALAEGLTHLDVFVDAPVSVRTASGVWTPKNYDGKYHGAMTIRTALARSINTVAVRIMLRIGVERVVDLMREIGIRSPFVRNMSVALGTPDLSLLEVVAAYAAFQNQGKRIPGQDDGHGTPPGRFVDLVIAGDGEVVDDFRDRLPEPAIPPQLAYLMADLMKTPVARGTARTAQELGRPAAGKTGTSTGWRDAWFIGFTADRIAGVWIGRDDFTPIGARATGGTAALPIWLQFMQAAHPDTPARDFEPPPDITLVRADELTGKPLPPGSPGASWVPFMRGTVPERFAPTVKTARFGAAEELEGAPAPPPRRPGGGSSPALP